MFKIEFNKTPWIYLSVKHKIDYLQRFIILHSIMYYLLDETTITDKEYDSVCKQLMEYKRKYKEEYKLSEYYYCMFDFDGNTGFDLYNRLIYSDKEYLMCISRYILRQYKGESHADKNGSKCKKR